MYVESASAERSNDFGLVHAAQSRTTVAPSSRRHSNVSPACATENDHDGDAERPGEAAATSIDGAGGRVVLSV